MSLMDDCEVAYYCFDGWMFGIGKEMPKDKSDNALRYWLNELGGLAGVW